MRIATRALIGTVLGLTALAAARAYSVQPMIYTLTPTGSTSSVRLSVVNSREGLLNVEIEPYSVSADDAGKRTFKAAPDDFLIFPPQASIEGDKTQLFQVRYIGAGAMPQGRVYVLRVHQTNTTALTKVDAEAKTSATLGLSVNFNTTAIVQPQTLRADVAVERDLAPDANGVLHARVVNRGDGVADLTRIGWNLTRDDKIEPVAIEDVKYGDAIFLEPGRARDIMLSGKIKAPARLVLKQTGGSRGGGKT